MSEPDLNDAEQPERAEEGEAAGPKRCGLIAIVGKPNVGKSTLLNSLVGQKISIVSRKAQTTRHRIQGVRTLGQTQFVFADTPGFQTRHSSALNKSLNKAVVGALGDVDAVLFVVEAGRFNQADKAALALVDAKTPCLLIANKTDTLADKRALIKWLKEMQAVRAFEEFMPLSAKNPKDISRLLSTLERHLPEQDWFYDEDELTDKSEKFLAAEIVREKLFRLTGDELPYTSTVVIDQFKEQPGETAARYVEIAATIIVERDSHKAMVIGEKGEKLKRIGTEAREELQKLMDCKMHLTLWVKVKSGWADNEAHVRSFGYT
jgi:GTPase